MTGQYIEINAGDDGVFNAYLAEPSTKSGPGILLLQEIFGVNHNMRTIADTYAEAGYVVVAPDLFWRIKPGIELGYSEEDRSKAYEYYGQFDFEKAIIDMTYTTNTLRSLTAVSGGVGALGYCLGGKLAYLAAAHVGVDVAIGYYPVGVENDITLANKITCPLLLHIAEQDHLCPPEAQARIQKTFDEREDCDIYLYPGVGHAFSSPERESYDKASSDLARSRSMEKLGACL